MKKNILYISPMQALSLIHISAPTEVRGRPPSPQALGSAAESGGAGEEFQERQADDVHYHCLLYTSRCV